MIASIAPEHLRSILDQSAGAGLVVAGLTRYVAEIVGTGPMPEAVGELLAQVEVVLDAGSQADAAALDALLGALVPLVATAGLDPEQLAALRRAVAGSPATAGPGGDALLAAVGAGAAPGGDGAGTGAPAEPALLGAAGGAGRASAAYRSRIARITVARNRRSASVRLLCPQDTPGCVVALQRTLAPQRHGPRHLGRPAPGPGQDRPRGAPPGHGPAADGARRPLVLHGHDGRLQPSLHHANASGPPAGLNADGR